MNNEEKKFISMFVKLPIEWVKAKRKEAKEKGMLWRVYAQQQIEKALNHPVKKLPKKQER